MFLLSGRRFLPTKTGLAATAAVLVLALPLRLCAEPLLVVATTPDLKSLAEAVGGDAVQVETMVAPDNNQMMTSNSIRARRRSIQPPFSPNRTIAFEPSLRQPKKRTRMILLWRYRTAMIRISVNVVSNSQAGRCSAPPQLVCSCVTPNCWS